jgi:copper chaperone
MNTIELTVQSMTCGSCVKHVSAALKQLGAVSSVEVDLAAGLVRVTGSAPVEALITALDDAGYPAHGFSRYGGPRDACGLTGHGQWPRAASLSSVRPE